VTKCAAALNLACLVVLVPAVGLIGAALAVTAGYFVLLVGVGLYSQGPDNPVRYEWGRCARGTAVFVTVYVAAVLSSGSANLVDAGIRLAWLLAVPPLLVLARVVDREHALAAIRRIWPGHRFVSSSHHPS
jgi:O-antigen/teichoic acid export membrane protein